MTREKAWDYVGYSIDERGHDIVFRLASEFPYSRLVGWQCGFEPLFIAIYSHNRIDSVDAEEIATAFLAQRNWFSDDITPREADYIL